jgi:diguanylate cyclase (GGDEF)-like protein
VRQFAITGDQSYASLYASEQKALGSVERRIAGVRDLGAEADELNALKEGIHWANALHDEQRIAIAARQSGDAARAQQIIFGPEYERELNRAEGLIERFQYRLDQRTETDVVAARSLAQIWRRTSEIVLGLTGLLFLCVLFFVFRRRVLHPVVRLSDVIGRLAAQDYAAEPPEFDQIDEIGDMAQALRVFRENGIERQRLENERDVDRMIRDLLSRMTQRMQGCEAMAELRAVVERFMPEIAPGYAGSLYLLDPVRRIMVEASEWHSPTHSKSEFSPLSCWALGRGTLHRPAGHYIDVPCDHLLTTADDPIDTICLPLVAQRETLGLIYDLAMTDALTGLANRRRLDAVVESLLAEAISQRAPISCIMLDVDHFKHFNDEFGHEAGDTVLREVGAVLKASSRNGTTAFRYGGEEFALFIPGIPADEVVRRAEEIRGRIAALRVRGEGRDLGPITVSLGVASAPEQVTPDKLLQTADAALRRAKQTGRNRVVTAVPRSAAVG